MNACARRPFAVMFALSTLVVVPLGLAAACGGAPKPPFAATAVSASASASASGPLFTQSSGASPIHVGWQNEVCDVEIRDALGATYRHGSESAVVEQALRGAVEPCLSAEQGTKTHGTVYVEAKVGADGALSEVVVSPGGAVSTDVAQCISKSFGALQVPPPKEAGSVLMLFVVSACPVR